MVNSRLKGLVWPLGAGLVVILLPLTILLDVRFLALWLLVPAIILLQKWPGETVSIMLIVQFIPLAGLVNSSFAGGSNIDGVRTGAFGGLLLVSMLGQRWRRPDLVGWTWAALIMYYGLALSWSETRAEGLRFLLHLFIPGALYGFCWVGGHGRSVARAWRFGALGTSLVAAVLFLLDLSTSRHLINSSFRYRAFFGGYHPASFAFLSSVLAVHYLVRALDTRRIAYMLGFTAFAAQAALTQTRIAVAALAAVLLLLLVLSQTSPRRRLAWAVASLTVVLVVVLSSDQLVAWFRVRDASSQVAFGASSPLFFGVDLTGRLLLWRTVLEGFVASNHLLGAGAGASEVMISSLPLVVPLSAPHQEYLRLLTDGGAIGLGLFLVWAGVTIRSTLQGMPSGSHSQGSLMEAAEPLGIVVLLLITALTDNSLDYYLLIPTYLAATLATYTSRYQDTKGALALPLVQMGSPHMGQA